jgi:RecA-family ATPase
MSENDIIQRTHSVIQNKMEGLDFYTCQGFNICNEDDFTWLKKVVVEKEYKLIVLDTFSMAHDKNENDNTEINIINKKMIEMTNKLKVTILFLHHHRKPVKGEIMSQSSSRGATDIIGKTAGHMLLDSKEIIIADAEELDGSRKGLRLIITQMKKRQIMGFEKFSVLIWYDPLTKKSNFKFEGFEVQEESALVKIKTAILEKMDIEEECTMEDLKEKAGNVSTNIYTAVKELIEIDKRLTFRLPNAGESFLGDRKLRSNSKIYQRIK